MICVADGNFQHQLKASAKRAGKIERSFSLPSHAAANRLERIEQALGPARARGLLPAFPLGSDMTDAEESLTNPLLALKRAPYPELLRILLAGSSRRPPVASEMAALERMGMAAARHFRGGWAARAGRGRGAAAFARDRPGRRLSVMSSGW